MADFPRIQLSKIGWDVDPSREAITVDLTGAIQDRINRLYRIITKAEDDRLKDLFRECFQAGRENASMPAAYSAVDFEEWWSELLSGLRKELDRE